MDKLKVYARVAFNIKGKPTESYILKTSDGKKLRVILQDALELTEAGYIDAKVKRKKYLNVPEKLKVINFSDLIGISYVSQDTVKYVCNMDKMDGKDVELNEVIREKRAIKPLTALVSKETGYVVGYVYGDGSIFKVTKVPNGYRQTITKSTQLNKRVHTTGVEREIVYRDIRRFRADYGMDFKIIEGNVRGVPNYIKIHLNRNGIDINGVNVLIANGELSNVIYVDSLENEINRVENFDPFMIAERIGYKNENILNRNGICVVIKPGFRGIIVKDMERNELIKKCASEGLQGGMIVRDKTVELYDRGRRNFAVATKRQMYKYITSGGVEHYRITSI